MTQRTWRSGASVLLAATLLAACTGGPPEVTEPARPGVAADSTDSPPAAVQGGGGGTGEQVDEQVDKPVTEVAADQAEPYVVKGRVLDPQGQPMPGVSVLADNTMWAGSAAEAVTDADGAYRIDLSLMEATWSMFGQHTVDYDGQRFNFRLEVDDSPFASHEGAVRDFVWRIGGPIGPDGVLFHGGNGHAYQDYEAGGLDDITLVTLHFVPSAPLVDGSEGEPVSVPVDVLGAFGGVPLGHYTISATYGPPGAEQDLLIQAVGAQDAPYAESLESGFAPGLWGGELDVRVRLP